MRITGRVGLIGILGLSGCGEAAISDGDSAAGSDSSATEGDGGDGGDGGDEGPSGSTELVGIGCEVEILWTNREPIRTREFIAGPEQDFYMTGRHAVEDEGVGLVTRRLVDGEVVWADEIESEWPASYRGFDRVGRSLVRRPDGAVWVFGTHQLGDTFWSWITAYSSTGAQLWQVDYPDFEWGSAAGLGDRVVAMGRDTEFDYMVAYWLADDGQPERTYILDGLPVSDATGVAIADDGTVWGVGSNDFLECGWRGTWTIEGDLIATACPEPSDERELLWDVETLANGSAVAVGRNDVYKPSSPNGGGAYFGEPLFVHLAEDGSELARWTYGPGVFLGGEVEDVAVLPSGDVVGVSTLHDVLADEFGVERAFIHRLTADLEHVADCELTRPAYAGDYIARADRVEVDSNGDIIMLIYEQVGNGDSWENLPDDLGGQVLVRITGLGE